MRPWLLIGCLVLLVLLVFLATPPVQMSSDTARIAATDGRTAVMSGGDGRSVPVPGTGPRADQWRRAAPEGSRPEGSRTEAVPAGGAGWLEQIFSVDGPRPLQEETTRAWLAAGSTNAAHLLALRQAGGGGRELVERALAEFPNDPRAIIESLAYEKDPEVRRQRLERFRAVDPDNPLADYLSASTEFAAGRIEEGIQALSQAADKRGFNDYLNQAAEAAEQVFLADGRSPAEAKALGSSTVLMGHLTEMRQVSRQLAELQSEALAAGDGAKVAEFAQRTVEMSRSLASVEGTKTLIGELVGVAIERQALEQLPPDATYEFYSGTAAERLQALDDQRREVKALSQGAETWMRSASDAELQEYFDRLLRDGERAALGWIQQRPFSP